MTSQKCREDLLNGEIIGVAPEHALVSIQPLKYDQYRHLSRKSVMLNTAGLKLKRTSFCTISDIDAVSKVNRTWPDETQRIWEEIFLHLRGD